MAAAASFALVPANILAAQDAPQIVSRTFDVRDLVADGAGAGTPVLTKARAVNGPLDKRGHAPRRFTGAQLADFVVQFLQPGLGRGEAIAFREGRLFVQASPDKQRWIARVLETNSAKARTLVQIASVVLLVDSTTFDGNIRPLLGGKAHAVVPDTMGRRLMAKLAAIKNTRRVISPGVTVHPLRCAKLQAIELVSLVEDFDVELASEAAIADPVADVDPKGRVIRCAAALLGEAIVGVQLSLASTEFPRPISEFEPQNRSGNGTTVQRAEVGAVKPRVVLRIAKGEARLIAIPLA
ncbi:MAG: hypothetical protein KDC87_11000, partial [Planctomycetes bacterium]|nr:hypothetical protein [Planctomycetota bacterium]